MRTSPRRSSLHRGGAVPRLLAATLLAFAPTTAGAAVFDVTPASNLQSVIDSAGANSDATNTIRFAGGTYGVTSFLSVNTPFANRTLIFERAPGATAPILDGQNSDVILWVREGAQGGHVIIDGLTFTRGKGNGSFGAAIQNQFTELTVRDSVFSNNTADRKGGAIAVDGTTGQTNTVLIHVIDSTFSDNTSNGDGGAIQIGGASGEVSGSTFLRNQATGVDGGLANNPRGAGGALVITQGGTLSVSDSTFTDNNSKFAGGAITIFDSNGDVTGSTFTGNKTIRTGLTNPVNLGDGGAVHGETTATTAKSFIIKDNSMIDNEAGGKGAAIHVFTQATASTVIIEGNTIRDNHALQGGGIGNFDLNNGNSVQTVRDNVIESNHATERHGGAIVAFAADVFFEGNRVEGNTADINQPGVNIEGTECALIQRNEFVANVNSGSATIVREGALRLKNLRSCPGSSRSALVENNFFYGNRGDEIGALLIQAGSPPISVDVVGNTFVDNHTQTTLAGAVRTQSSTRFRNNIFARDNLTVPDAFGIRVAGSGLSLDITSNDFHQNAGGTVSDTGGNLGGDGTYETVAELNGLGAASSNVDDDPDFVDAASGNLRLQTTSNLIDEGDCSLFSTPRVDIDGEGRPVGSGCDIGADEVLTFALTVTTAGSGSGTVTSNPSGITCPGDCSQAYASGTVVALDANPGANSVFSGFSGDADCADGQVTMSAARSCTATFVLRRTLDVIKTGLGAGTATSTPAGIDCGTDCSEIYDEGTTVALAAVPDFDSEFTGFAGAGDCADGTVAMTGDLTCEADFEACSIDSIVNLGPMNVSGGPQLFEACNRLTAGNGGFALLAGATVTFRSGNEVNLRNDFSAGDNVTFTIVIGPP